MKSFVALLIALVMAMTSMPAYADVKIHDGIYQTKFPKNHCGILTVNGGKMKYKYGPCGRNPTFRSGGYLKGNTINITWARFKVEEWTGKKIKGYWTLGSYSANHTFSRQQ